MEQTDMPCAGRDGGYHCWPASSSTQHMDICLHIPMDSCILLCSARSASPVLEAAMLDWRFLQQEIVESWYPAGGQQVRLYSEASAPASCLGRGPATLRRSGLEARGGGCCPGLATWAKGWIAAAGQEVLGRGSARPAAEKIGF